jgi:hypothetical protein
MLSLADVLARGCVASGAVLEATLTDGRKVTATLRADGWIDLDGALYQSPSAAGGAAKEHAAGTILSVSEKSTDGWAFWKTRDANGDLVALKELRRRAAESK